MASSSLILFILEADILLALIILGILTLTYFTLRLIIKRLYSCQACNGKGILSGENAYLELEFKNDICYCCHGKGIVFKGKSEWYDIAKQVRNQLAILQKKKTKLNQELQFHSSAIKISKHTKHQVIWNRESVTNRQVDELKSLLDAKINYYTEVERNAHIFMHSYYVFKQQEKME